MDVEGRIRAHGRGLRKQQTGASRAARIYPKAAIPYGVSEPKRFWRIKKDLPSDVYWKKRYWRRRITGRGDYRMDPEASFGRRWGGYLGAKAGEFLGGAAQSAISGLVGGLGSYSIRRNVFLTGRLPTMVNNPAGGGSVIRFQEYLGDVISSSAANGFKIDSYLINAANPTTLPFLSQLAANYEQYEIEGMIFEFRSMSADALNSVNTALGTVIMATQYDVSDPVFTSKTEMMNYEYSTATKPSDNVMHMIECDPRQTTVNELYTLTSNAAPAGTDPRLYFLGRFSVATQGFQGTSVNVGQLHVTYQVRLLKPKLYDNLGFGVPVYRAIYDSYADADPLFRPTSVLLSPIYDTIGINLPAGGDIIQWTRQNTGVLKYFCEATWIGTPAAWTAPTVVAANGTIVATTGVPENAVVAGVVSHRFYFQTTGLGGTPSVTYSAAVLPTAGTQMLLRIFQVPPDYP